MTNFSLQSVSQDELLEIGGGCTPPLTFWCAVGAAAIASLADDIIDGVVEGVRAALAD